MGLAETLIASAVPAPAR